MSEQRNTELVKKVYGAIGNGDMDTVLRFMSKDVDIHLPGPSEILFAGSYRGHDDVGEFFGTLAGSAGIQKFEPREFIDSDNKVVVTGREKLTAKPTGKPWETNCVMIREVRDGKVTSLREFHETGSIAAAYQS